MNLMIKSHGPDKVTWQTYMSSLEQWEYQDKNKNVSTDYKKQKIDAL